MSAADVMTTSLPLAVAVAAVVAAATVRYVLHRRCIPTASPPNEPPSVPHWIPYIGHIIGILRHGTSYYTITSTGCDRDIYTLTMLDRKVYVVRSPRLVAAVYRNPKVLAFNPFIAQLGKRITGHDAETGEIVQRNLNGEQGSGYVMDVHDGMLAALAPGESLQSMVQAMLREAATFLHVLEKDNEVDLFAWARHMMTMCSTRAIYGPENPFNKNPGLVDTFWDFDHDLNALIIGVAPSLVAPRGNRARLRLAAAFEEYFNNYNPGNSSALIQARHAANNRHGISLCNQARLEVGSLIGILVNAIPTLFYLLVHVYSDSELLQDLRVELEATSVRAVPGQARRYLLVRTMRDQCNLLHSTFQELLRLHALGAGARFVREDILLDDQYLLKKGMVVQIPMAVMQSDISTWGEDANEFRPRRFLRNDLKRQSASYRPFGGGASLCPGRHFVTWEMMALTAWMVLMFDMDPVDQGWKVPRQKQESLPTNVFPPAEDIRVTVTRRRDYEKVDWDFMMA